MKTRTLLSVLGAAALLLAMTGAASAQTSQIIVVSPIIGDNVASGNLLRSTVDGITDASSAKRYVVKVEPGTYELGGTPLNMKEWVDLEGSGTISTRIIGFGGTSNSSGMVNGIVHSEIRDIRLVARTGTYVIAYYSSSGGIVSNVEAIAKDGDQCWAIRFGSGSGWPTVRDGKLTANCSMYNSGISSKMGTHATIYDTQITSSGASNELSNIGLYFDGGAMPTRMTDIFIKAGDGTTPGVGIRVDNDYASSNSLEVVDTHITTALGIGIYAGTTASVKVRHSNIVYSRIGVEFNQTYGNSSLRVHDSILTGNVNTVVADFLTTGVYFGASQLYGGPISAPTGVEVKCAGVYDESFNFYPSTCP